MNGNPDRYPQFLRSPLQDYLLKVGLIAIAYAIAAKIAVSIPGINRLASAIWPPAGISQASLILLGFQVWPGIACGAFLFDIIQQQLSPVNGLASACGASLQAIFAVILLKRFQFRPSLERVIDVVNLIIFGAILAPQINSTLGIFRLGLLGLMPWQEFWQHRWSWFLGDAMGVLIFTPLILVLCSKNTFYELTHLNQISKKQYLKAGIGLVLLITVSVLVFVVKIDPRIADYPLEYLPLPLIIWATLKVGQRASIVASFLVSSIAILGGSQGGGPFITKVNDIAQAILLLQTFMGVMIITTLLLAAVEKERLVAERSLRKNELKYRELVENANSIILKIDPQGNITFFNEFAQSFFGYSQEEIIGKNLIGTIICLQDSSGNNLEEMLESVLKNPLKYTHNENENIKRNGERVWVAWSNKPLQDEQGSFAGILCIGTDITKRRRAELALHQLNEELEQRVTERTEALRYQQEQSEKLLLNVLPEAIAERLKRGDQTIADRFEEVTVLFADIVNFTEISSRSSPETMVDLLNQIFSTFDQLAEKYGLEKIKTIGDAYMVVGGLPTPRQDHAEAVAEMALEMRKVIAQFQISEAEPFNIRIGINSGPVVAGVIGIKKFIYDLWGDTVNIASRMEALGQTGQIQVTEATYQRLQHQYQFQCRGEIKVKGKGTMITYFLLHRKATFSRP